MTNSNITDIVISILVSITIALSLPTVIRFVVVGKPLNKVLSQTISLLLGLSVIAFGLIVGYIHFPSVSGYVIGLATSFILTMKERKNETKAL